MIGCLESVGGCAFPSDKAAGRSLFLAARPTRRSTEHRSESGHRIVVVTGWARSHERSLSPAGSVSFGRYLTTYAGYLESRHWDEAQGTIQAANALE